MRYKALLFDFDGVIGRTMEDNYNAWAYAFDTVNVRLDRVEYFLLEGRDTRSVASSILRKNSLDERLVEEVVAIKEEHYLQHNSFEFYPGAVDFINSVANKFKLGLVSGASTERLEKTLPAGFLRKFQSVITSDKIRSPKPSPEPYLLASSYLGVSPSVCLVIENAPLGIASAKEAKMDCVAVCSTLDRKYLSDADFIVDNVSLLKQLFQDINGK